MPESWYLAMKYAIGGSEPKFFTRDFCRGSEEAPHGDYLFPSDASKVTCPHCRRATRFDRRGNPLIFSVYADVRDAIARVFESAYQGELLRYGASTVKQDVQIDERYQFFRDN